MDYQSLGMIDASTTHTTDVPSQKNVQQGENRLELLETSQGTTRLELLVSPRVQTLRGMTPLKPLSSPHGTTPFKPSARAWVLTSYYICAYIPTSTSASTYRTELDSHSVSPVFGKNAMIL